MALGGEHGGVLNGGVGDCDGGCGSDAGGGGVDGRDVSDGGDRRCGCCCCLMLAVVVGKLA